MIAQLGQTFAPLGDPTQQRPGGGPGSPTSAVGQAIQTLSLRYPRVQGAAAIAPNALLTSPGSAGLPQQGINPVLDAILRGILGNYSPARQVAPSAPGGMMGGITMQSAPSAMGGQPSVTLPTPRVTPGFGESQATQTERPPYTPPPAPLHPGPRTGPPEFPERTREGSIIGGGFEMGRGIRY